MEEGQVVLKDGPSGEKTEVFQPVLKETPQGEEGGTPVKTENPEGKETLTKAEVRELASLLKELGIGEDKFI